jgi:hypothetical protein
MIALRQVLTLATFVLAAVAPDRAAAQQRELERFPRATAGSALVAAPVVHSLRAEREDRFNFLGFLLFGAAGTVAGAYAGYHIDRYFGWSQGDDPGLGGFVIGALVGGTVGAIYGGHLGNE